MEFDAIRGFVRGNRFRCSRYPLGEEGGVLTKTGDE